MTTLTDEQMERAARELCRLWKVSPSEYDMELAHTAMKRYPNTESVQQAIATAITPTKE